MVRGYQQEDVQQRLFEILSESKTGLSGVEIAEKLGLNRATMAKYLNVFAAEGIIKQKSIGNANLWFLESGTEKLQFPDDYFHVKERFLEFLTSGSQYQVYQLIRNCQYSGASIAKIVGEVIMPAISSIEDQYLKAKIGKSEAKLFYGIISNSIRILLLTPRDVDSKKNLVTIAADTTSAIYAEAASCALCSGGWQVMDLGDMSGAIDVMYDLDLQKLLTRIWKQKQGVLVVAVFSATDEGTKFFSESVNSIKPKFGKNLHVVVHSRTETRPNIKAEFVSESFDAVLQWTDSIAGSV
ncbi:helix-turn-helix domain-containing protein [Candidatus Nitrosotenuis cloacae]|uniref:helix-turn-helix domain-containing protein n=1 Tax=Candidatus Nitrosotenuis cloacae TaxID=1603555 RepID=UPI0022801832|nr:helix-turn-helix domain-containing protein [Candidatus Nitrosotenuis cloacae]